MLFFLCLGVVQQFRETIRESAHLLEVLSKLADGEFVPIEGPGVVSLNEDNPVGANPHVAVRNYIPQ